MPQKDFHIIPKIPILLEYFIKTKTSINFRDQAWNRPVWSVRINGWLFIYELSGWWFESSSSHLTAHLQSLRSRTLFYPISIMPQFLIKDFVKLKQPKNVKSINNATGSHLVSCRVIPSPATMKGWKKYLKNNYIKNELVQKDFLSILLNLQVTSLDSSRIIRTTVLQNTS